MRITSLSAIVLGLAPLFAEALLSSCIEPTNWSGPPASPPPPSPPPTYPQSPPPTSTTPQSPPPTTTTPQSPPPAATTPQSPPPTAAPPSTPAPAQTYPIPGMPGWSLPFPVPGWGVPPAAAPPTATNPAPAPTATNPPAAASCIINASPQIWKTAAQLSASSGGMCTQKPRMDGNLTITSTSATTAHLEWNSGEYSDDAALDLPSCTITRSPPGKTQQVQGITGHVSYRITVDASSHLSGTAHANVDVPFAPCQADYAISGTK